METKTIVAILLACAFAVCCLLYGLIIERREKKASVKRFIEGANQVYEATQKAEAAKQALSPDPDPSATLEKIKTEVLQQRGREPEPFSPLIRGDDEIPVAGEFFVQDWMLKSKLWSEYLRFGCKTPQFEKLITKIADAYFPPQVSQVQTPFLEGVVGIEKFDEKKFKEDLSHWFSYGVRTMMKNDDEVVRSLVSNFMFEPGGIYKQATSCRPDNSNFNFKMLVAFNDESEVPTKMKTCLQNDERTQVWFTLAAKPVSKNVYTVNVDVINLSTVADGLTSVSKAIPCTALTEQAFKDIKALFTHDPETLVETFFSDGFFNITVRSGKNLIVISDRSLYFQTQALHPEFLQFRDTNRENTIVTDLLKITPPATNVVESKLFDNHEYLQIRWYVYNYSPNHHDFS